MKETRQRTSVRKWRGSRYEQGGGGEKEKGGLDRAQWNREGLDAVYG